MTLAVISLRASRRELEAAATSDGLTGLANRRQLMADLERRAARGAADPAVLLLFDLDGFKSYNDAFGHLAGDALLTRSARRSTAASSATGVPIASGGDEFCVLADADGARQVELAGARRAGRARRRLRDHRVLRRRRHPEEATDRQRGAAHRRPAHVRAQELRPRDGPAPEHRRSPARPGRAPSRPRGPSRRRRPRCAEAVGRHLGLDGEALDHVRVAAELHDVGKVAIPDAILNKPGPLDDEEWAFMRRHTLIGERIVAAAPALGPVAKLVRASHERWDGDGYPDRTAGEDIPLGARIVAVCDAYDAIVADRPYRRGRSAAEAMAELAALRRRAVRPDGGRGLRRRARGRAAARTRPRPPSRRAARSPARRPSPPPRRGSRPRACRWCPSGRRRSGRRSR